MALPWVRVDSNIAMHDKILGLIEEKDGYRSAFSYICSLGYSAAHETDGLIKFNALTYIHGNRRTAQLLVQHHLWQPDREGWSIVNYEKRQQLSATAKHIRNVRRAAAEKGNCVRWHGEDCKCWEAS